MLKRLFKGFKYVLEGCDVKVKAFGSKEGHFKKVWVCFKGFQC